MGYKLDDKDIKLTGKNLKKIGTGKTGDVYKYKNSALKIFKKEKDTPIDYYTADYLTGISTNRILLPRNLLFYNNAFKGYTYKLVSKKGTGNRMIMLPTDELIEDVSIIEKDIEVLSNKQVLLNGIEPDNTIFNGRLYLTDPTGYTMLDIMSTEELERLNKYQFHLLLIMLITQELKKNNFSSNTVTEVKELLEMKDSSDNTSDYLKGLLEDNDTFKQFVKRMD